jgi:hypothetical protein
MDRETTVYDGIEWHRYPKSKQKAHRRYFQKHRHANRGVTYLHRYVWEKFNGPIPEGYVIHHKDRDTTNNALENLECITTEQHHSEHSDERSAFSSSEQQISHLDAIRELTKEWHASDEGRQWHSAHAKSAWAGRTPTTKKCKCCGEAFDTLTPTRADYCGGTCYARHWRSINKPKTAIDTTCAFCGARFTATQRTQRYCSESCRTRGNNRSGYAKRKAARTASGVQPDS